VKMGTTPQAATSQTLHLLLAFGTMKASCTTLQQATTQHPATMRAWVASHRCGVNPFHPLHRRAKCAAIPHSLFILSGDLVSNFLLGSNGGLFVTEKRSYDELSFAHGQLPWFVARVNCRTTNTCVE
jgi:hypothetical protein